MSAVIKPTPEQLAFAARRIQEGDLTVNDLAYWIARAEAFETQSAKVQPAAAAFPASIEQFYCPDEACQTTIPPDHVFNEYPHDEKLHTQRRLCTVHCPSCERIWERGFILRGGMWQPDGDVKLVERSRKIKSIQHALDQRHGVQLAQAS